MKIYFLFLFSIFCLESNSQSWTQLANFTLTSGRVNSATFDNGSYGFICTGSDRSGEYNDLWRFDPTQNSWLQMANFIGSARKNSAYFQIDSIAYVGIGVSGASNYFNNFYAYNMNQNTWSTIANYPGTGRRLAFCTSVNGKGYVAGGVYGSSNLQYASDFWEYDPLTNAWTQITSFPLSNRAGGVSFSFGDDIYFGLGHNGNVDYNDLWAFNTVTRLWTQKTSLPGVARLRASWSISNGMVLVGGGFELGISLALNDYYIYDAASNSWSSTITFTSGSRSGANSFAIGNLHYLMGGVNRSSSILNDLWEFSISSSSLEHNLLKDSTFLIYPNPAKGEFFLNNLKNIESFTLFNSKGEIVYNARSLEILNRIDVSYLNQGVYFYLITSKKSSRSGKIFLN